MKDALNSIARVATEVVGVFLILSATAEAFDATETVAFAGISAVLVTVEVAMWFSRRRERRVSGYLGPPPESNNDLQNRHLQEVAGEFSNHPPQP